MSRSIVGSVLLSAFLFGSLLAAPPLPLDLIPDEACIAISIRNLAELKVKSDKLLRDVQHIPRFSEGFQQLLDQMKFPWAIDEKAAMAGICAAGKLGGFPNDALNFGNFHIGTAIPYAERDDLLKKWKLDPEKLRKGEIVNVPGQIFADLHFAQTHLGLGEKHAFMSGSKEAVAAWLKADTLRKTLPPDRQKRLDVADGLVYLGPPLFRFGRMSFDPDWAPDDLNERERQAHRRLNRLYTEARSLLGAYRLDDGLGLDLTVGFDPRGKESQSLIRSFATPGRSANMTGMPVAGPVIGSLSIVGSDPRDLEVIRALTGELFFRWYTSSALLASDLPALRRILGDVYGRMKLLSGALYATGDKARVGPLALVAILEPRDTAAFLREVQQMARLADVKAFEPRSDTAQAEITKLVAELGHDDFEVREAATTRLALIGEPALDALRKGEKSDDAEVRRRAGEIREQLERVTALRKQELAKGLLKQAFHPQFAYKSQAEERAGVTVHHLSMAFDAENAPFALWLRDMFGPDWNRIRLAVAGDRVIALLGSDLSLLDQAIRNVRENRPGLEASPTLAGFRKQAGPNRRAEIHLALRLIQQLTTRPEMLPKDFKPSPTLSSLGLRTGTADIALDVWAPADAVPDAFWWFRF